MYALSSVFRLFNLPDIHATDSFAIGVLRWCRFVEKRMKSTPVDQIAEKFPDLLVAAWKTTHIRCQACENLLDWAAVALASDARAFADTVYETIRIVQYGIIFHANPAMVVREFLKHEREHAGQLDYMTLLWTNEEFVAHPSDRFAWRDFPVKAGWPTAIFYIEDHKPRLTPPVTLAAADETMDASRTSLLSGQQNAFDQLGLMLRARREKLTAAGMTPRLHGLLLGPSGSGKTHVVRCFARAMSLPIFEQSAASWLPQGAKTDLVSAKKLAQFVGTHGEGIIFIDEIEKPFPADLLNSSAWERANADELMSLLDAKTGEWEGWTSVLAQKLDRDFFVVLSGAWQDAYLKSLHIHELLGGDWTNLSIADEFFDNNHLPPELLNRVSTNLIEVLPPSRAELSRMILSVQRDLGLPHNAGEAERIAKEIVEGRKGLRGVEEFMLRAWMKMNSSGQPPETTDTNLEFDF